MRNLNRLGSAVCLLALGACAATASPEWDARFGDSVRILKAQQLIEPGAADRNAQASPATDGRTANEAMGRHVESYRTPPPTNVINTSHVDGQPPSAKTMVGTVVMSSSSMMRGLVRAM